MADMQGMKGMMQQCFALQGKTMEDNEKGKRCQRETARLVAKVISSVQSYKTDLRRRRMSVVGGENELNLRTKPVVNLKNNSASTANARLRFMPKTSYPTCTKSNSGICHKNMLQESRKRQR